MTISTLYTGEYIYNNRDENLKIFLHSEGFVGKA